MGRELLRLEVGRGEPVEEARGRQDVAVRLDLDVAGAERLLREPERRPAGEVPPLAVLRVLGRRDLRDPGDRGEEDPAGRENPVQRRERRADVVDELERLRDDRAVEAALGICGASVRSPTIVASGLPSFAIRMSTCVTSVP